MKIENKNLKQLKSDCWKLCSEYNRRKDTGFAGRGHCITCFKIIHWTQGDAGHFQSGRGNAILFYDKGIHLQCKRCNGPGHGEQDLYSESIRARYGKKEVIKQRALKHTTKKYTKQDYIRLINVYRTKIAKLNAP
jgi:hypothetical protein